MSIKARLAVAGITLSAAGLGFIASEEGTRLSAYLDPVGVPTICTGSTRAVYVGQRATLEECEVRLAEDTGVAGRAIARLVQPKLTQGQYDALVSFTFNVGEGALARSTLLRKLNAARTEAQCLAVGPEFSRWIYAGGKPLRGLQKRRAKERAMFESGCASWRSS